MCILLLTQRIAQGLQRLFDSLEKMYAPLTWQIHQKLFSSHPELLILRTKKAETYVLVAEQIEKPYLDIIAVGTMLVADAP